MKKILIFFLILYFWGCATPYGKFNEFNLGGYKDTQLSENMYRVQFIANGFTNYETASDMCLLRCAELCVRSGYNYFIIIDERDNSRIVTHKTERVIDPYGNYGGQSYNIQMPRLRNTIVCFKDKPDGVSYDAQYITRTMQSK